MRNTKRLVAIVATGATAVATMFYTALGQAPPIPPVPTPTPAILQSYQSVTAERLKNPEPGNWLMIRRTYDGWGYSPLNQINTGNVSRLRPVWGLHRRLRESRKTTPPATPRLTDAICSRLPK